MSPLRHLHDSVSNNVLRVGTVGSLVVVAVVLLMPGNAIAASRAQGGGQSSSSVAAAVKPASLGVVPASDPLTSLLVQQVELTASDPAPWDLFGVRVAISGDTALVAAFDKTVDGQIEAGTVYVFTGSGMNWTQQAELPDPAAATDDRFGSALAISGDTALIGAYGTIVGGKDNAGVAYVFVRSGSTWTQQAEFSDPVASENDYFGSAVALDGDTALVGASGTMSNGDSGAAYVFARSGNSWSQQADLTSLSPYAGSFGTSVAVSGDTAMVGAAGATIGGQSVGATYVFVRSGATWSRQAELSAADATAGDLFGSAVALDGDTALIGAPGKAADRNNTSAGAAYVFTGSGANWSQQAEMRDPNGDWQDEFGGSVALSGATALVGSNNVFTIYVYERTASNWPQELELTDPYAGSGYGLAVALSGNTVITGAIESTVNGLDWAGTAYVVPFTPPAITSLPSVTGTAMAGDSLACAPGSWSGNPVLMSYQWLRTAHPSAEQQTAPTSCRQGTKTTTSRAKSPSATSSDKQAQTAQRCLCLFRQTTRPHRSSWAPRLPAISSPAPPALGRETQHRPSRISGCWTAQRLAGRPTTPTSWRPQTGLTSCLAR